MTYPSDFTELSGLTFFLCDLNSAHEEARIYQAKNLRRRKLFITIEDVVEMLSYVYTELKVLWGELTLLKAHLVFVCTLK